MKNRIINGLRVYAPASFSELINFALQNNKNLIAVNAEKILHANDNLKLLINDNIGYPDGIGAVWALQKKGCAETIKIPGCELWLKIIEHCYTTKSFYFIGATNDVIAATVIKLQAEFPAIRIVNYRNGFITNNSEKEHLIEDLQSKKPDIVFVAMGSPRQENLIQELQKYHKAVYQGLGGSFDVYTGIVKRAPKWWVKNNLEWAFRLIKQPARWQRHLHLIVFFCKLQLNRF